MCVCARVSVCVFSLSYPLQDLTELFGTEWAKEYLLPSVLSIHNHESYLQRLTAVHACGMMSTKLDRAVVINDIIPIVLEMAADDVANIRFNVAQTLSGITLVAGVEVYRTQVQPVLTLLSDDPDRDVVFFANKTCEQLEQAFALS